MQGSKASWVAVTCATAPKHSATAKLYLRRVQVAVGRR